MLTSDFVQGTVAGANSSSTAGGAGGSGVGVRDYDVSTDMQQGYLDFEYIGWMYNMISLLNGFNSLFTWFKIFSFLRFLNSHAQQFIETIAQAAANLVIFMGLLSLVIWAYAQTVFVSFGADISEYKTIESSLVNTFKAMIEGFDLDEFSATNEYLGPLLWVSFLFVAFFVMLNMFLAIIMKTYDDVNAEEGEGDEEGPMAHEFREGLKASLRCCFGKRPDASSTLMQVCVFDF